MANNKRASPPTDGNDYPRAKRMRKGTRSCAECRRRKIKCIFDPTRPDICNDCHERGADCIDQEQAHDSHAHAADSQTQTLRGRVSQLEDLVKTLITKLDDDAPPQLSRHSTQTQDHSSEVSRPGLPPLPTPASSVYLDTPPSARASNPKSTDIRQSSDLGGAPLLGLFQNDIVEPQGGWNEESTTATAQDVPDGAASDPNREEELRQTLISYLPSPATVKLLAREFGDWWGEWSAAMPELFGSKYATLEQFLHEAVRTGSPAVLGRTLLALALSMQEMPAQYDYASLNLRLPPHELSDFYARQVYNLVLSDDELAGTFAGVECLVVFAKYSLNAGRPRKAWLAHRRAVTFAQLLNLHRRSSRMTPSNGFSPERKEHLWIDLYIVDHVVGLIFGQPYTICHRQCDIDTESPYMTSDILCMVRLATIAGRINERNQELRHSPLSKLLSLTISIDEDLQELGRSLSTEFYQPGRSRDPNTNNQVLVHFLHAQVRTLLHLPFMLKSAADKRFQPNRTAALEESRRMIDLYERLRSKHGATYMCKMSDFQAFTSAMLLLLNMLGYARDENHESKKHSDWDYVTKVKDMLQDATIQSGGKVSLQCVRALELFTNCRGTDAEMSGQTVKVMVPFYGTLVLGTAKGFTMTDAYKSGGKYTCLPTPPAGPDSQSTSPGQTSSSTAPTSSNAEPFVGFDSFANPFASGIAASGYFPTSDQQDPLANLMSSAPTFSGAWDALPGAFNMDLDHDWNWYMGDSNAP